jgi:hypothetical protein
MKLGDKIHNLTQKLGIRECGGCKKRREALNALGENPKAFEVLKALFQQEETKKDDEGPVPTDGDCQGKLAVAGRDAPRNHKSGKGADGGG